MLIADVNVLVNAYMPTQPAHERVRDWLGDALTSTDPFGLLDATMSGFVRVATDARIWPHPSSSRDAAAFVQSLIDAPASRWIPSGAQLWRRFAELADSDPGIRGTVVPDAYLAAAALAHGARLATADRGFGRFPGLRFFDPSQPGSDRG